MPDAKDGTTKPLTVRIPVEEYEYLKEYAGRHHVSMNCLVSEAIAAYRTKIERGGAVGAIQAFQDKLRDGRAEGSDSADLLHQLRETRSGFEGASGENADASGSLRPGQSGDRP